MLEALGLGIPFITSRGGGIPELIHPLDLERATYAPTDDRAWRIDPADPQGFVAGPEPRASRQRHPHGDGRGRAWPARALRSTLEANEQVHVEWHERVAAEGAARSPAPVRAH